MPKAKEFNLSNRIGSARTTNDDLEKKPCEMIREATLKMAINEYAEKIGYPVKNIYVIDSKNNSVTEGLIVMKAIELIKSDKTKEEIVETLESLTNKTNILVCLDTFKYATMSGRVPKAVGKFGMFIGLRPIMSLADGKGTAFGFAFRQKGITKKIVKLIKRDMEKNGINSSYF